MWGTQRINHDSDAVEEVTKGEMLPFRYLIANASARFSDSEKAEFINGLKATFGEGEAGHKMHDEN